MRSPRCALLALALAALALGCARVPRPCAARGAAHASSGRFAGHTRVDDASAAAPRPQPVPRVRPALSKAFVDGREHQQLREVVARKYAQLRIGGSAFRSHALYANASAFDADERALPSTDGAWELRHAYVAEIGEGFVVAERASGCPEASAALELSTNAAYNRWVRNTQPPDALYVDLLGPELLRAELNVERSRFALCLYHYSYRIRRAGAYTPRVTLMYEEYAAFNELGTGAPRARPLNHALLPPGRDAPKLYLSPPQRRDATAARGHRAPACNAREENRGAWVRDPDAAAAAAAAAQHRKRQSRGAGAGARRRGGRGRAVRQQQQQQQQQHQQQQQQPAAPRCFQCDYRWRVDACDTEPVSVALLNRCLHERYVLFTGDTTVWQAFHSLVGAFASADGAVPPYAGAAAPHVCKSLLHQRGAGADSDDAAAGAAAGEGALACFAPNPFGDMDVVARYASLAGASAASVHRTGSDRRNATAIVVNFAAGPDVVGWAAHEYVSQVDLFLKKLRRYVATELPSVRHIVWLGTLPPLDTMAPDAPAYPLRAPLYNTAPRARDADRRVRELIRWQRSDPRVSRFAHGRSASPRDGVTPAAAAVPHRDSAPRVTYIDLYELTWPWTSLPVDSLLTTEPVRKQFAETLVGALCADVVARQL